MILKVISLSSISKYSLNEILYFPILRNQAPTEALLEQPRAQIASDQKLKADALNTAGQVRDRAGHVLGEEKLASTLNVMPPAAFCDPSSAHQYRRHLIAA